MLAFGEFFVTWRPPVDLKTISEARDQGAGERREARGAELHHPAPEMGHPLDLFRQPADADAQPRRPGRLDLENDARKAGIVDNDWVEVFNTNGVLTARAVVSQRMKDGTLFMYHAQEKIVNTPGSNITGKRGGIHNSVTRAVTQADPHDRRLRPAVLRLQLLRHRGLQPRRVRHRAQDGQGRLARHPPATQKKEAAE
jgi:nitrate reductase / nitrite oxidoreductase, alpha subunit